MNMPVQAGYVIVLMALNLIMIPRTLYYIIRHRNKPLTPAEEKRITQIVVNRIMKELER